MDVAKHTFGIFPKIVDRSRLSSTQQHGNDEDPADDQVEDTKGEDETQTNNPSAGSPKRHRIRIENSIMSSAEKTAGLRISQGGASS